MNTTKEQFKLFKESVEFWLDKFDLSEWEVFITHKKDEYCLASCVWDVESRQSTINLSTVRGKWYTERYPTPTEELYQTAYHEVMHIVLCDINYQARSRHFNEIALEGANHAIINRIWKVLND